jgi:hypothetical protein
LSTVFAGQKVGVKQVAGRLWLVSFMHYYLGFVDNESCRGPPRIRSALKCYRCLRNKPSPM